MDTRYRQQPGIAVTIIEGEAAIVTMSDSRLHLVNRVGTRIWELCGETGLTLDELTASLCDEFEVDAETAQAECLEFLRTGVAAGFLVTESA